MALYASADGTNWTNSTNWLSDAPLSDWYGVITDSNGLVIELNLSSSGLSGEIPPEFGELVNLRKLSLGHNNLTGEIPPQLGGFSNLKNLSLDDNSLTGQIPRELGNLTNLVLLYLGRNQLSGEISGGNGRDEQPRASEP